MKRDPHVRSYADPGPLVPGVWVRFRWPEPYDDDVRRVREDLQEEGRGLFVLRAPFLDSVRCLVEAYYPEDIRQAYFERELDPLRRMDCRMGRLVVVGNDLAPGRRPAMWRGPLDPRIVTALRASNRSARADLKRQVSPLYFKQALQDVNDREEDLLLEEWTDQYAEAFLDTLEYQKPKVSMYGGFKEK